METKQNEYRARTKHGYMLDECISSLQKHIRRGQEVDAMKFAWEISLTYPYYLWHRLRVICMEDICPISNPQIALFVDLCRKEYFNLRLKGSHEDDLILANAILAMSRAKKSRLACDFLWVVKQGYLKEGCKLNIPDYGKDMHTQSGREEGKGMEHFITEGCMLGDESNVPNIYRDKSDAISRSGKYAYEGDVKGSVTVKKVIDEIMDIDDKINLKNGDKIESMKTPTLF